MIFLMIVVLSTCNMYNRIAFAQVSITTPVSVVTNMPLLLECKVTSFSSGASWSHDNGGTILTQCFSNGICTDSGSGNYQYTSDSNGINVTIAQLTSSEQGITWTCAHSTFSANFTVQISSTPSSGDLSNGAIAGISVCCLIVTAIIIFLIWKYWPGHGPPIPPHHPHPVPPHHPHPAQPTDKTQPTYKSSTQEALIGSKVVLLPQLSKLDHLVHSVEWIQNDKPVSTGEDCAYKGGNTNRPSLEISSVSNEDFGPWKCILESENSKQIFVVQLTNGSGHSKLGNLPPLGK